jgi:uncharacterized membrane protein
VTYEHFMSDVVRVVETAGAAIMIIGAIGALVHAGVRGRSRPAQERYDLLRQALGRVILLGLEVLIIGDIIRTLTVEPTLESVAVLAAVVLIRIVLSFSIEVEIDGRWPWRQASAAAHDPATTRSDV